MLKQQKPDLILVVLLVCSVGANAFLLSRPGHGTTRDYDSKALTGRPAPPLVVESRDGQSRELSMESQLLLYVISPRCGFCKQNTENMKALARQLGSRIPIVGISLERAQLDIYLESYALPFEVAVFEGYRDSRLSSYGFGATPALYLIDKGIIQRAWGGALTGASKKDLEDVLQVQLPGIVGAGQPQG